MCHGEFIRVHEQFVRKRGADFEKLKSAELVDVFHLRQQRAPVPHQSIAPWFRKETISKKSVNRCFGRQRENILISLQPVLGPE